MDRHRPPVLAEVNLSQRLSRAEEADQLRAAQVRLAQLRLQLGGMLGDGRLGPPVTFVFEGWDAAGKGGAIKRLVGRLDPRHFRVAQYAAPTPDELRHHWLSRFWPQLPGWGGMAVYDRSWYGRVLVERVEGFAKPDEWRRAYGEIRDFEHALVDDGMIFIKNWIHISSEQQLKRFKSREHDTLRSYKLTDEDWRNREKWDMYEEAIDDMFRKTSTSFAPWDVIPGENKRFARVAVVTTAIERIESGMRREGMDPLPAI